jgi:hypothetical protein
MIGYETVILNEFLRYANGTGVLYSAQTDEVYNLGFISDQYDKTTSTPLDLVMHQLSKLYPFLLYIFSFILIHYLINNSIQNLRGFIEAIHMTALLIPHRADNWNLVWRVILKYAFHNVLFIPIIVGYVIHEI